MRAPAARQHPACTQNAHHYVPSDCFGRKPRALRNKCVLTFRLRATGVLQGQFQLLYELTAIHTPLLPDVQQSFQGLLATLICLSKGSRDLNISEKAQKMNTQKQERLLGQNSFLVNCFIPLYSTIRTKAISSTADMMETERTPIEICFLECWWSIGIWIEHTKLHSDRMSSLGQCIQQSRGLSRTHSLTLAHSCSSEHSR